MLYYLSFSSSIKVKRWGPADWNEDNIHVYAYSQLYFPQRFNLYWDSFKEPIWRKLLDRVEMEQGTPDVIHLHYPTMISVPNPILSYKKKNVRIIVTEHWTNVLTGEITQHAKNQLTTYVEEADKFICVGNPLKESIVKLTGTKKGIEVVPNIVPETFNIEKKPHKGVRFVAAGRLIKNKQFDRLISTFAKIFSDDAEVSLTIIGDGSQFRKLKKLIKTLGADERINLVGAQPRAVVAELMAESDALVSFSRLETFGVPVIEGWYSGIPAVATTAIGFAEYWEDFLGELIPFDEEKGLENALRKNKNNIQWGGTTILR